jgi:dihydroorotase
LFNAATTDKIKIAFSSGIRHVIVNGTFVLKNGKKVTGVLPGQPVHGKFNPDYAIEILLHN